MSHRYSLRVPRLRTTALGRGIIALVAVTMMCSACLPFPRGSSGRSSGRDAGPRASQIDSRFLEFPYTYKKTPEIQEQTDDLNDRWPELAATNAHLTLAYSRQVPFMPDIEPEFWMTGVANISDDAITMLLDKPNNYKTLLPGIYPGLYKYVPEDCSFTNIDLQYANDTLRVPLSSPGVPPTIDPMIIQGLAVSQDCHLMVITALGHRGS